VESFTNGSFIPIPIGAKNMTCRYVSASTGYKVILRYLYITRYLKGIEWVNYDEFRKEIKSVDEGKYGYWTISSSDFAILDCLAEIEFKKETKEIRITELGCLFASAIRLPEDLEEKYGPPPEFYENQENNLTNASNKGEN
jgi:hypothetical protein